MCATGGPPDKENVAGRAAAAGDAIDPGRCGGYVGRNPVSPGGVPAPGAACRRTPRQDSCCSGPGTLTVPLTPTDSTRLPMTTLHGRQMPEVWLRGPVPDVPSPLQPVAHALLQALEDAERLCADLDRALLWQRPGGAASIGFHLRHMTGSLDRLLTYARDEPLSEAQRRALELEKMEAPAADAAELLGELRRAVAGAIGQLRASDVRTLDAVRRVGRARLPSTVLGLLYHAGEHSVRHAGQISTTLRVLTGTSS
jgi:uncharacterized damage-inducible protein DinB